MFYQTFYIVGFVKKSAESLTQLLVLTSSILVVKTGIKHTVQIGTPDVKNVSLIIIN